MLSVAMFLYLVANSDRNSGKITIPSEFPKKKFGKGVPDQNFSGTERSVPLRNVTAINLRSKRGTECIMTCLIS